ncbi:hypothetical protein L7F22_058482 [Adiantum nelumboides]|nr:hypothetical protein [Adiantum nelumboides]
MAVSFPTFYGHHDENARDFMDSLEMAHLMAGRDQEEVKLRAFPLVLKGEARVWYDALAPPSKTTWPTLYGAFLNKYGQGDTPEDLWKQLLQHRQGSLGDYNTYESKFTNLWERWAASLQGQGGAPNFLKRDKFVEGMFPTLKEKVEAKFPQTFEEAQEIATVKFKKLLYQERKSNCVKEREEVNVPQHTNNAQPKVAPISADSHQEDLLHKLTQQLETLTLNLVQAPTRGQQPRDDARPLRRSTQELRCWNCNETGHGMYHCPHPRRILGDMYLPRRPPQTVQVDVPQQPPTIQRGPPPNQEQARGPRRQAQEYHCYNCGENGHGMYYCRHPRRIGNFRGPRDQVSPPRERQQQQPPFPIQQAPPVQIPRPPMQPQSQQSPSPPPPIVPIPPLPIQENRVVNVLSLDVKVKSKKEDRGKSLPKDKGKAKVEDVDVLSIKRSRKEEVAISERRERRKSKENGDSSSKKKSKPKRKITTKDLALGESYQPYNLVDDALIHGPKITWPQLLHLASKVRRQWTQMVSTRCVKTKAMGLVSNRNLRDITPALEAYVKGKRVSNVYVDGGAQICDMIEQTMHHLGLKVNAPAPCTTKMANNAKGEGYPIILGRPWLMAMQARQDWGTGMLKLQPHQGAKKGKAIHIDLRAGKHESLDLGTSVDEFSSSKYFTSREKSIVTEYSDSSQAKIMEVMITNPVMVSSNNILQVKEGFLVDGYNQITGAFMVHINKQQVMPQMLATTFAKFSFDFLLKTFVNVTMEGSLSLVLWHWVLFAHVSKWVAPLQGSNYTMQTWSSIGLVGMLTHECYEEKIKLASLQAGQGKEVVLLGETHSPNLDGVYTIKLNKATIEIVIYNEKEAKLFGVNLVVDRFMFSDALLSAKQVKIPWICGSQSLVSQDWKEVKLVKKIIGTQPLLTKEIRGVSTTTSESPYYEVIANKKLLQVPLSQQRKHWLDTMRLLEIEAFSSDPNKRRRWLIRKATRYKNRYKSRLVARGFSQKPSLDYSETFLPILSMTLFRAIVALAAHYQFHLHQLDIKTAFLHGDLDEELYLQPPPHYEDSTSPHYVCRLHKAIYSLKQSPRQWYLKLHQILIAHGYSRLQTDSTIYTRHTSESILVLTVYVDIPIMSDKEDVLIDAKKELSQDFPLTDGGPISYCLGLLVQRDHEKATISLSQSRYVTKVLQRFNLSSCKGIDIPLTPSVKLISEMTLITLNEQEQMTAILYMPAIGEIRYLVTCIKPDICFTTGYLSRFMQDLCLPHWKQLKHLLRYIKAT